jgi:hypothetical protein
MGKVIVCGGLRRLLTSASLCAILIAAPVYAEKPIVSKQLPAASKAVPLYKNANAAIDARVEDLLKRMTLEEKIAQIITMWDSKAEVLDAKGEFDAAKMSKKFPTVLASLRGQVMPMVQGLRALCPGVMCAVRFGW